MVNAYRFEENPHTLRMRLNLGLTGFGKSDLLRYQIAEARKACGRYILVDPTADKYNFANFGTIATPTQIARALQSKKLRRFEYRVITRSLAWFKYLCFEACNQGDCYFVVDEVHNFCDTKGGTKMQPPEFNLLATEGRHQGVRFMGTCQRPTQVHNNLLKLCQEVNVFRTEDLGGGLKLKLLDDRNNLRQAFTLAPGEFLSCKNAQVQLCAVPKK